MGFAVGEGSADPWESLGAVERICEGVVLCVMIFV